MRSRKLPQYLDIHIRSFCDRIFIESRFDTRCSFMPFLDKPQVHALIVTVVQTNEAPGVQLLDAPVPYSHG